MVCYVHVLSIIVWHESVGSGMACYALVWFIMLWYGLLCSGLVIYGLVVCLAILQNNSTNDKKKVDFMKITSEPR